MMTTILNPTVKSTLVSHRKLTGAGISGGISGRNAKPLKFRRNSNGVVRVRAVISSGDRTGESTAPAPPVKQVHQNNSSNDFVGNSQGGGAVKLRAVLTIKKKIRKRLGDKIDDFWFNCINSIGKGIFLKLISQEIDPATNKGKTVEAVVVGWPSNTTTTEDHLDDYTAEFDVPSDFGKPGAILVTNLHEKEFYLVEIALHGLADRPVFFPASSWIHSRNDNPESRIVFRNYTYLPSETPAGIRDLRREDLLSVRGNGQGERKPHDRIYDYAPYNDLGNPDENEDLTRPVLGGSELPYPRRCRTGRPFTESDPESESIVETSSSVYVPRDEKFEETKRTSFSLGNLKAVLHNLIPQISASLTGPDAPFAGFADIDKLYVDGFLLKEEDRFLQVAENVLGKFLVKLLRIRANILKYDLPAVFKKDRFSWLQDTEFARQALAGVNPVNIELLKEFPIMSKLEPSVYGPQESAITKEVLEKELEGITVEEAIENKRLFIIDYHDFLMPFLNKINVSPGRKAYASRTIFFRTSAETLQPIVIELSLPPNPVSPAFKRAYTHGYGATSHWIWKLAKAHVCAVDAGVHQLVNHWLKTHASMEAYSIATHRQLSQMHPIYKLLHSHTRYTMEINALARQSLINAGGVIESTFTPGKYSMEISSAAYSSSWRFDMESLPADLLRRGMAVEDPEAQCGVRLVVEDYPYAADGLLVWSALTEWVESYVAHFYPDPSAITADSELQEWWNEIKTKGHADKKDEPWWPKLETKSDLTDILCTIIWAGSAQHAAINFGQYPFGGYIPNRPTIMRKLIPQENEPEYAKFVMNPQAAFLSSMPSQLQATKVMAVQDSLSTHSPDEEYLGQEFSLLAHDIDDQEVKTMFERFTSRLEEVEEIIHERNNNFNLRTRNGAGVPPYELYLPTSGPGVTGRGIPNSISI